MKVRSSGLSATVKDPNNNQEKVMSINAVKANSNRRLRSEEITTVLLFTQVTINGATTIIPNPSADHHNFHVSKNGAPEAKNETAAPGSAVNALPIIAATNSANISMVRSKEIFDLLI